MKKKSNNKITNYSICIRTFVFVFLHKTRRLISLNTLFLNDDSLKNNRTYGKISVILQVLDEKKTWLIPRPIELWPIPTKKSPKNFRKSLLLTRDLKDYTIFYQGIRLPCKLIKIFAILSLKSRQPLFGSLKTLVPHFKLLKSTPE